MNNYLVVDAITEMDTDIIAEYLEMKKDLLSNFKKKRILKINWKGWATLVACFILIVSSVLLIMKTNNTDTPGGVQNPDKLYNFGIGDICNNDDWNGTPHSVVFNKVYVTNSIGENSGNYIVFIGEINTSAFSFPTVDARSFGLDLRMIKEPEYITQNKAVFEENISDQLSEVDLLFNGEEGEMSGAFCLVFSIDEQNFNLIKEKSLQTSYEDSSLAQITLEIGVYWSGGASLFEFNTTDTQYIDKLN